MDVNLRYNPAFEPFFHTEKRYAILYGGAGSGKSVAAAQKIILRTLTDWNVEHRWLCVRKFKSTLRESVFELLSRVIKDMGLQSVCKILETNMTIDFANGSNIVLSGVDDPEKLKSIQGVTGVWIEEITELDELDFDQIDLRIRGETDRYKQIIGTFNPVSETHWLKNKFFDNPTDDVFSLHTNYTHNLFIDEQYKKILEERYSYDENMYRIYVKGEWGRIVTGSEFYTHFNYARHVGQCEFIRGIPLHISFDFNVNPYMPAGVFQVSRKGDIYRVEMLDEIALKHPDNRTEEVCLRFKERWGGVIDHVYIYGDATGKNRSPLERRTHYDIITENLKEYVTNTSLRILPKNPSIAKRRMFMNKVLAGGYPIEFAVNPTCKLMINDLESVLEDADGKKFNQKKRDRLTGIAYESTGHFSDLFDYFFVGCFTRFFDDL